MSLSLQFAKILKNFTSSICIVCLLSSGTLAQNEPQQGQGAPNGSGGTANAAGGDQVRAAAINAGATPAQADAAVNAFNQAMADTSDVPSDVRISVRAAVLDVGGTDAQADAAGDAAYGAASAQYKGGLSFGKFDTSNDVSGNNAAADSNDPCKDEIQFTPPPVGPGPITITMDGTDVTIDPAAPAGGAPTQTPKAANNQQRGESKAAVTAAIAAGADQVRSAAINAGLTPRQADQAKNAFLGYASGYSAVSPGYVGAVANYVAASMGGTSTDAVKNAALVAARYVQKAAKLPPGAKVINGVIYYPPGSYPGGVQQRGQTGLGCPGKAKNQGALGSRDWIPTQ